MANSSPDSRAGNAAGQRRAVVVTTCEVGQKVVAGGVAERVV
jgi:hypothetical protein